MENLTSKLTNFFEYLRYNKDFEHKTPASIRYDIFKSPEYNYISIFATGKISISLKVQHIVSKFHFQRTGKQKLAHNKVYA